MIHTNPGHDERPCLRVTLVGSQQAHGPHEWRIHHSASDPPEFTYYWCLGLRAHPDVMIGRGPQK